MSLTFKHETRRNGVRYLTNNPGIVVPATRYNKKVLVKNTGTVTVYLGFQPDVDTLTGFPLEINESIQFWNHQDDMYGVVAESDTNGIVHYIIEGFSFPEVKENAGTNY